MAKFIVKKVNHKVSKKLCSTVTVNNNVIKENNLKNMTTEEKVKVAQEILGNEIENDKPTVKRLKKDKGLIERKNTNKIILTEENKELLND